MPLEKIWKPTYTFICAHCGRKKRTLDSERGVKGWCRSCEKKAILNGNKIDKNGSVTFHSEKGLGD